MVIGVMTRCPECGRPHTSCKIGSKCIDCMSIGCANRINEYKGTSKGLKQCFCIGPENCQDESCTLVQAHKKRQS